MKMLSGLSLSSLFKGKKFLVWGVIVYATLGAVFSSHYLYNWDAGQLALGAKYFSLFEHQPHPPGYYLFVKGGQLLSNVLPDINSSLIVVNSIAGFFALLFFIRILRMLGATSATIVWSTLLFFTNPVTWFYRSVALTYTFESLTALVLTFTTLLTIQKKRELLPLSTGAAMLLAGFRPSVVLIAFPFLCAQLFYTPRKGRALVLSVIAGIFGLLFWLPALVHESGGVRHFSDLVMAQLAAAHATPIYDVNENLFFLKSMLAAALLPLCMILTRMRTVQAFANEKKLWFLIGAIAFHVVIILMVHFGEVGYLLGVIPLLSLLSMPVIASFISHRALGAAALGLCVVAQVTLFIYGVPLLNDHKLEHIRYADIRVHDKRVNTYLEFVRRYDPRTIAVIVLRGQYLGPDGVVVSYPYDDIRLLSYYLPEYTLTDLLGVRGTSFVAKGYRYRAVSGTNIQVPASVTTVLFLADYIHPSMRPSALELKSHVDQPSPFNIYWAPFPGNEFEYNGIVIRKQQSGILES